MRTINRFPQLASHLSMSYRNGRQWSTIVNFWSFSGLVYGCRFSLTGVSGVEGSNFPLKRNVSI